MENAAKIECADVKEELYCLKKVSVGQQDDENPISSENTTYSQHSPVAVQTSAGRSGVGFLLIKLFFVYMHFRVFGNRSRRWAAGLFQSR